MTGWVKLYRELASSEIWLGETFTRGQAWVDLIILANHRNGYIRIAGEKIEIKRGQCGWSVLSLSKRWKWSRGKADRFLFDLENEKKIEQKRNNRNTIITICNYDIFQNKMDFDSTTDGHQIVQQIVQQTDTNKNDKNNNIYLTDSNLLSSMAGVDFEKPEDTLPSTFMTKKGEMLSIDQLFERFWEMYPQVRHKGHKGKAKDEVIKKLKAGVLFSDIGNGIALYRKYCEATGEKNPDMFRWIRDARYTEDFNLTQPTSTGAGNARTRNSHQGQVNQASLFSQIANAGSIALDILGQADMDPGDQGLVLPEHPGGIQAIGTQKRQPARGYLQGPAHTDIDAEG